jgi:hypothetical protein
MCWVMAHSLWGVITLRWCGMETVPGIQCWRSNHNQMFYGTSKASWHPPELEDGCNMCTVTQTSICWRPSSAQRVNFRADNLATAALIAAVEANDFISSIFPLEKVCVEISGERVAGSPKNAITELWGEQVAQELYDRWGVVSKENFPLGGHGVCSEIVPRNVPCLGNKTCITFSGDQPAAFTHRQIGSECMSKL